jgi:hypothetical protein
MQRCVRQLILIVMCQLMAAGTTLAALGDPTFSSSNYSVVESQMGGTGDLDAQSSSYRFDPGVDDGGSTLGDTTGGGNSTSTSYQTNGGYNTTAQPGLSLSINSGSVDFGNVSVGTQATGTTTFSVINYTSYGYAVTLVGNAPTYGGHALSALATDTSYNATAEQFGVNLVLNTVAGVGADPVQVPGGPPTFGYGVAGDGSTGTYGTNRPYTVSDKWRFVSGETVASAPRSSGQTTYTMSLMMNAIQTTPGGKYSGELELVATGTF